MPETYDFDEMVEYLLTDDDAQFTMTVACDSLRKFTFDAPASDQNFLVRNEKSDEDKQQPQFHVFKLSAKQIVLQAYDEERNILVNIYIPILTKKKEFSFVRVQITNPSLCPAIRNYTHEHAFRLRQEELSQCHFAKTRKHVNLIDKDDVLERRQTNDLIM